ncbi:hypothetical protein JAO76_14970 [Pontibacter sp. BT310]|uniref:Uncharacterized protein n=1 Tax=Pontibacter populi TaxID=890055 RepID=A0ABS6XFR8_9BACT|nr:MULTISPECIES: hypothetical protein [Pontibacter]MBJ6119509.1 hypothetical protein [Pontibacter sp. BT310]MBR0571937.1 hypothetical protein [Microvirga sp. STS03]MBW3366363.1 hypothetical protein [Pontibacter populi]
MIPVHEQDRFTWPYETIIPVNLEVSRFKLHLAVAMRKFTVFGLSAL